MRIYIDEGITRIAKYINKIKGKPNGIAGLDANGNIIGGGGASVPPATETTAGTMSAADKVKVDNLGTASTHAATDFDAAGAASTAQSTAEGYTDTKTSGQNLISSINIAVLNGTDGLFSDSSTNPSINWSDRKLLDSSSDASVDWENYILEVNSITTLDWFNGYLCSEGEPVVNWGATKLIDGGQHDSLNWGLRHLISVCGALILDYSNVASNPSSALFWVDPGNNNALTGAHFSGAFDGTFDGTFTGDGSSLNVNSALVATSACSVVNPLKDSSNNPSANFNSRQLLGACGGTTVALEWGFGCFLNDSSGVLAITSNNRYLYYDDGTTISVDWDGGSNSGQPCLKDRSGGMAVDWGAKALFDNAGSPNVLSVDWAARGLYCDNGAAQLVLDWQNLQLVDLSTVMSIDWKNRLAIDSGGSNSIDWNNRELTSACGISFSWGSGPASVGFFSTLPASQQSVDVSSNDALIIVNNLLGALQTYGLISH